MNGKIILGLMLLVALAQATEACVEPAPGSALFLSSSGMTCETVLGMGATCDIDLSNFSDNAPVGSYLYLSCPCSCAEDNDNDDNSDNAADDDANANSDTFTLGIGSCHLQLSAAAGFGDPTTVWESIASESPDAFLFLGDNTYNELAVDFSLVAEFGTPGMIYSLSEYCGGYEGYMLNEDPSVDLSVLVWKCLNETAFVSEVQEYTLMTYANLMANPNYASLINTADIYTLFDDHDYAKNNWDITYPVKKEMRDFLVENFPKNTPWSDNLSEEGVYQSFVLNPMDDVIVHMILLDYHYWLPVDLASDNFYGDEQWAFIEQELARTDIQPHIRIFAQGSGFIMGNIDSSVSGGTEQQLFNYPNSLDRFLNLLDQYRGDEHLIFLSGDWHYSTVRAEVTLNDRPDFKYTEIVSSALMSMPRTPVEAVVSSGDWTSDTYSFGLFNFNAVDRTLTYEARASETGDLLYSTELEIPTFSADDNGSDTDNTGDDDDDSVAGIALLTLVSMILALF